MQKFELINDESGHIIIINNKITVIIYDLFYVLWNSHTFYFLVSAYVMEILNCVVLVFSYINITQNECGIDVFRN